MKKLILFSAFFLLFTSYFLADVKCEETNTSQSTDSVIQNEYSDFANSLGDSVKDKLPEDFGVSVENDATELTSWDFLLYSFGESFVEAFRAVLPSFARLIGVIVLISLVKRISELADRKSADLISSISSLCISVSFVFMQYSTVMLVKERLTDISSLATCMMPVFATLYSAGGNVGSAYVSGGGLGIFIFMIEQIIAKTSLPFFGAMFCLASTSAAGELKLNGLIKTLKKTYTNFLTFTMSVFCAILASQSLIAAGRDSVSLRAAKFITSSSVPIVGSAVGESLKSFAAGIGTLRKSVGGVGVVIIILLILPTILLLLLNGALLNFASSFAEMLGCDKEKALLENISGIYTCLCATLTVGGVTFAFMLIMLALSAVALKT